MGDFDKNMILPTSEAIGFLLDSKYIELVSLAKLSKYLITSDGMKYLVLVDMIKFNKTMTITNLMVSIAVMGGCSFGLFGIIIFFARIGTYSTYTYYKY